MVITAVKARRSPFSLIDKVNADRTTIEITPEHGNAVLMSAAEYVAWRETVYLFRSPANAQRLLHALGAVETGQLVEHPLDRSGSPATG